MFESGKTEPVDLFKERTELNDRLRRDDLFGAAELMCNQPAKNWQELAKDQHKRIKFDKDGSFEFSLGSPLKNITISPESCEKMKK